MKQMKLKFQKLSLTRISGSDGRCWTLSIVLMRRGNWIAVRKQVYVNVSVRMLKILPKKVNDYSKVISGTPMICCNFYSQS